MLCVAQLIKMCYNKTVNFTADDFGKFHIQTDFTGEIAMGKIIKVQCLQCGFEKQIFSGGGLMDCNIETILKELPQDGQRTLSDAVKHGASRISITREPCSCDSCGEIYAVPIVNYTLNNTLNELFGICPKCSEKKRNPPSKCPVCGKVLSLNEEGLWD